MPLPTMHLWVARKIAERAGLPISGRYLLGNIAPDAIHGRRQATPEAKYEAHLRVPGFADGWDNALELMTQSGGDPFLLGCALHILLDHKWVAGPYIRFKKSMPKSASAEEIKRQYSMDCEYIERWLFKQNGSQGLWTAVLRAPLSHSYSYVTSGEIDMWRKMRFAGLSLDRNIPPARIISLSIARAFMENAADTLVEEINARGIAKYYKEIER